MRFSRRNFLKAAGSGIALTAIQGEAGASQLGIALDPAQKEVLVATGEGNQIRTYSVPEVFEKRTEPLKSNLRQGILYSF